MAYNFTSIEDAQKQWHTLDQAGKDAAHQYVVNAKAGTGEVFDPRTGIWYKPETSSPSTTSNTLNATKKYYVPGQQSLEDAIAVLSYTPRSYEQAKTEASNLADIQINPQKTQLQLSLQKAISDAQNQKRSIEANYATIHTAADRLLEQAQKRGTESAIARGGGRSGAVEYAVGELSKPIHENVMQAEAQKAANLANIDNALATINENYNKQIQALEEHRGALAAAQLAAILNGDQDKALAYAQARANAEFQLSNLLDSRDRYNQEAVRADTALTGVAGGTISGTVGLRDYLNSMGVSNSNIHWDPGTGNVTINGKTYTPNQLKSLGGYIQNDRWQIPESVIRSLL